MESKDFRITPIITPDKKNSVKIELRQRFGSIEEAQGYVNEIVKRFEAYQTSITWSVEDFMSRAKDNAKYAGKTVDEMYDTEMFDEALDTMISNHDCNNGITWIDVDMHLDNCKR